MNVAMNDDLYELTLTKYGNLLYGEECFTGNLTTRRFHTPLHPGPEWRIFRMSPL